MSTPIQLDGSLGEGGGQILRTALALSVITRKPFRLFNLRAGRSKPGLAAQHLACVTAAARIGAAVVDGASLGSQDITFTPGAPAAAGVYRFNIATAGSTVLVLQTVLPMLMLAGDVSTVEISGGTHNPKAPTPDFLIHAFAPVLERMGPTLTVEVARHGFYPAGGGLICATISPVPTVVGIALAPVTRYTTVDAVCLLCRLDPDIAERELATVSHAFGGSGKFGEVQLATMTRPNVNAAGTGNALMLLLRHQHGVEVVSVIGERGVSSEQLARSACDEAREVIAAAVPVGPHLADQLLLPMALAAWRGGGESVFYTTEPTSHTMTNMSTIQAFLPVHFAMDKHSAAVWRVGVRAC